MGRPAKSLSQHLLADTKLQSKASAESHVRAGKPRIPSDLSYSLRKTFRELCSLLAERRSLSKGDVELVALYCNISDRYKRNLKLLQDEGEIVTYMRLDSNGHPVPQERENLRVKLCSGCERQMVTILAQLGLTPTAKDRARPTTLSTGQNIIPGSIADLRQRGLLAPKVTPIVAPRIEPEQPIETSSDFEVDESGRSTN